jgi:hypothetical protein
MLCLQPALQRHRQLAQYELRAQPEHAIPRALGLAVALGRRQSARPKHGERHPQE